MSYEGCNCLETTAEYYRMTGKPQYLKSVEREMGPYSYYYSQPLSDFLLDPTKHYQRYAKQLGLLPTGHGFSKKYSIHK